jgi:hypothetical protein
MSNVPPSADIPAAATTLLVYIHARFREAFGAPNSMLSMDSQWSLRSHTGAPAIFVLVNGSYEKPAVWVFDPFATENVWRTSITTNAEVDGAIEEISRRTARASRLWPAAPKE